MKSLGAAKNCRRVTRLLALIAGLATGLGGASGGYAMGAFTATAYNFWSEIIASYWWSSHADMLPIYDLSNPRVRIDLLEGEREPIGLVTVSQTAEPPNASDVTCSDFSIVRLSDIDPTDGARFPFRVHQEKSALYLKFEGWLSSFGRPSHAQFWLAAMLPDGSEPLFNANHVGLNNEVMSRPFLAEIGWSSGLPAMPADQLILRDTINCAGFRIYSVEYNR